MKTKNYLILYYICFIATILFSIITSLCFNMSSVLLIINVILGIIFTGLIIKIKKINVNSLIFPISYIIFFIVVVGLCILFNTKVLVQFVHFGYYQFFILINFLLLNVYSILCVNLKENNINYTNIKDTN